MNEWNPIEKSKTKKINRESERNKGNMNENEGFIILFKDALPCKN